MAYERPNYTGSYSYGTRFDENRSMADRARLQDLENQAADQQNFDYGGALRSFYGDNVPDFSTSSYDSFDREVISDFGKLPKGMQELLNSAEGANPLEKMRNAGLTDDDIAMLDAYSNLRKKGDPRGAEARAANEERTSALMAGLDLSQLEPLAKFIKKSPEDTAHDMMWDLARYDVSSLDQIGVHKLPSGETVYFNKETGQLIPEMFGSDMSGEGGRWFSLQTLDDGRVVPVPKWRSTDQNTEIAMGLTFVAAAYGAYAAYGSQAAGAAATTAPAATAAPATTQSIGSVMLNGGVQGATSNAIMTVAQGGDLGDAVHAAGRGFVTGSLSAGAGQAVSGLDTGSRIGNLMIQNGTRSAVSGMTGTALQGGNASDILQAGGRGFTTGALSSGAGALATDLTGSEAVGRVTSRTVGGTVGAAQSGDDMGQGARTGLVQGGLEALGVPSYMSRLIANRVTNNNSGSARTTDTSETPPPADNTSTRIGRNFGTTSQLRARYGTGG